MAHRRFPMTKWLVLIPVLLVLVIAAACGDDATPAPAPTPVLVDVAAIAAQVQAAVKGTVEEALKEAPTGPTPLSAAEIQSLVETAVGAALPEGASAADIKSLVDTALKAAITPGVTKAEVETLVTKAVSDAAAAVEPGVSATEVRQIFEKALAALPTPMPVVVSAPTGPFGTLNVGYGQIGAYSCIPGVVSGFSVGFVGLGSQEGWVALDQQGSYVNRLLESWSIAGDDLTWTFKFRKGIPFHKGYGEMTAEDALWSMQKGGAEASVHARAADIRKGWMNEKGYQTLTDRYTIEVNTGEPAIFMLSIAMDPNRGWVISKRQVEELGEDVADKQCAGTGPFEIVDHKTGQFWKYKAVDPHWRKTPEFAELVFWEILEESTRIANFQTGKLDTMFMEPDSRAAVARVPGTRFMLVKDSSQQGLSLGQNWYVKEWPGNDPNAAWASTNSDPASPEWERARKVREALGISIDRQLFVDTLLGGAGDPGVMWGWMGHESKLPPDMKWVFDPARARQLVKDAGYPNGFDITLTLNIRNNPAEKEQCEATAGMWRDIGLNVSYETPPYDTITRPKLADRSYSGAICHGTRFYVEPTFIIGIIHLSSSGVNLGVEHEIMDAFVAKINSTFDPEERWKVMLEMGQWQWDNAFNISIFNVHQEYPIGPKLDPWTEHMEKGSTYTLGDLEWTPHRK